MRTSKRTDRRTRPEDDEILRRLTHCKPDACTANPFLADASHMVTMAVRQLAELVLRSDEFPNGLDTVIKIGDVEGNNPTNGDITVTYHRPGDVVLSVDPHCGETDYGEET